MATTGFVVKIADTGEAFSCHAGESVLMGMARTGRKGIPVGCRGGGCGVCKVEVVSGQFEQRRMSCKHVTPDDARCRRLLACCIFPRSDMEVSVIGKLRAKAYRDVPGDCGSPSSQQNQKETEHGIARCIEIG